MTLLINLLLNFAYCEDNREKYKDAMVYTTRELWKQTGLQKYTKRQYKAMVDKETRNTIGAIFPVVQIMIRQEIKYEWEF